MICPRHFWNYRRRFIVSSNPGWKYWETVADNFHKAGWSLGWVSALDLERRTIWIVDAHRDDGKRFIVRADQILTAVFRIRDSQKYN
jgi:hypothetical protein